MLRGYKVVVSQHGLWSIPTTISDVEYTPKIWENSVHPRFFFLSYYSALEFCKVCREEDYYTPFAIYSVDLSHPMSAPPFVLSNEHLGDSELVDRFWRIYSTNVFFQYSYSELGRMLQDEFDGLVTCPLGTVIATRWRLNKRIPTIKFFKDFEAYKSFALRMPCNT